MSQIVFNVTENVDTSGDVNSIYCDGRYACRLTDIRSLDKINVNDNYNVQCRGEYSCYRSVISNFNEIISSGRNGLYQGNVDNGVYLGCFAAYSCNQLTATNVTTIVAGGRNAFENGIIKSGAKNDTNNTNVINVHLIAYKAAVGLRIECNDNDSCIITCMTEICSGLDVDNDVACNSCSEIKFVYLASNWSEVTHSPTPSPTIAPSLVHCGLFLSLGNS